MKVYLKNKETNEVISEFENVVRFGVNFVEMNKNNLRSKIYINSDEEYLEEYNEQVD